MRKLAAAILLALAACVGPTTTLKTVDSRPAIAIAGAPMGAQVLLDGTAVGEATRYDGNPGILRVEQGTHDVEIRTASGEVIFKQRVFVESELKTIQVH